jgi:hypothetical protein
MVHADAAHAASNVFTRQVARRPELRGEGVEQVIDIEPMGHGALHRRGIRRRATRHPVPHDARVVEGHAGPVRRTAPPPPSGEDRGPHLRLRRPRGPALPADVREASPRLPCHRLRARRTPTRSGDATGDAETPATPISRKSRRRGGGRRPRKPSRAPWQHVIRQTGIFTETPGAESRLNRCSGAGRFSGSPGHNGVMFSTGKWLPFGCHSGGVSRNPGIIGTSARSVVAQRDSNPCMIPVRGHRRPTCPGAGVAAGDARREPWHTSFAISSRRSASEG